MGKIVDVKLSEVEIEGLEELLRQVPKK